MENLKWSQWRCGLCSQWGAFNETHYCPKMSTTISPVLTWTTSSEPTLFVTAQQTWNTNP